MTTTPKPDLIQRALTKSVQAGLLEFSAQCFQQQRHSWNYREKMRLVDLAYIREQDLTEENQRGKKANRYGDSNRIQNITVPVVMPQVESAVAYQASVFLSGYPIFEAASNPHYEDEALQLSSILEDQSIRGGWTRELQLFFRDGFKYNMSALEVTWATQKVPALETNLDYSATDAQPTTVAWSGNVIKRIDPYNLIADMRCAPADIPSKGEFAGYIQLMSRIAMKDFINKLDGKILDNVTAAFESGVTSDGAAITPSGYYTPLINPDTLADRTARASTNWSAWAGLTARDGDKGIDYKNMYEVTTLYGRILPSDFGLRVPAPNTPQVWKFIIVNNSVIILAEPTTNAHQLLPIIFGQPLEDGLNYQTKSLADNAIPFQQVSSALLNQSLAASRKAIYDRMVYDPSRISADAINNPNPASKIPCRPAAYGSDLRAAFAPVTFQDDQSPIVMQKINQLAALTDEATGRNRSQRGLFTKGNRTKEEYVDVMQNASGRDQLVSILYETQVFTPLKEILKLNILQYQGGTTLYNSGQQTTVTIDPVSLRKAVLNFKVADGLVPMSKQVSSDTLQVTLQTLAANPQIGGAYNIGQLFSYLMKTQGADLRPFEKSAAQQSYEAAITTWQQTVAQVTEAVTKAGGDVAGALKSIPQPTPQQFNYTPGVIAQDSAVTSTPPVTIMQQILADNQTAQTAQAPQSSQPTGV